MLQICRDAVEKDKNVAKSSAVLSAAKHVSLFKIMSYDKFILVGTIVAYILRL